MLISALRHKHDHNYDQRRRYEKCDNNTAPVHAAVSVGVVGIICIVAIVARARNVIDSGFRTVHDITDSIADRVAHIADSTAHVVTARGIATIVAVICVIAVISACVACVACVIIAICSISVAAVAAIAAIATVADIGIVACAVYIASHAAVICTVCIAGSAANIVAGHSGIISSEHSASATDSTIADSISCTGCISACTVRSGIDHRTADKRCRKHQS